MFSHFIVNAQIRDWESTGCVVDGVPTLKCLEVVFGNLLFMSSAFIILVLFVMFVIGAFNYLTSLGNPDRIKKAQGTLKFAVIGFILFMSSFLIIKTIDILFLGGQNRLLEFNIGCGDPGDRCSFAVDCCSTKCVNIDPATGNGVCQQ